MTAPVWGRLTVAWRDLAFSDDDVYLRYVALGGRADHRDVLDYLADGRDGFARAEHNTLVLVMNEGYAARGQNHPVPYEE